MLRYYVEVVTSCYLSQTLTLDLAFMNVRKLIKLVIFFLPAVTNNYLKCLEHLPLSTAFTIKTAEGRRHILLPNFS